MLDTQKVLDTIVEVVECRGEALEKWVDNHDDVDLERFFTAFKAQFDDFVRKNTVDLNIGESQ